MISRHLDVIGFIDLTHWLRIQAAAIGFRLMVVRSALGNDGWRKQVPHPGLFLRRFHSSPEKLFSKYSIYILLILKVL